jgi:hypothetical protein
MSQVPVATVLADFDRHVAEMRARIVAGRCKASWGETVSGEMTVRVLLDGRTIAELGPCREDGEGPE